MTIPTATQWREMDQKQLLLFGMSGLGKTHVANLLRASAGWFHYSVDYRIGTRYMGEHIVDNFKREAMLNPFLADLLLSDSIYIASNITFDNLAPLSTYLGKPGNPDKGGLPFEEYSRRQSQHRAAEISALLDTGHFIDRSRDIYNYSHFVCDTGGSICEVVDPEDPNDPVLTALADRTLMIWIEGSESHTDDLIRRFDKAPKPMYYQPEFLAQSWARYLDQNGVTEDKVDPDNFVRWTFAQALAHRQPRYAAMAQNWGISLKASDLAGVRSAADVNGLIERTLEARQDDR